jgi:hypothetical protein
MSSPSAFSLTGIIQKLIFRRKRFVRKIRTRGKGTRVIGVIGQLPFGEVCSHISLLMAAMKSAHPDAELFLMLTEDGPFFQDVRFSQPMQASHLQVLSASLPSLGFGFTFLESSLSTKNYLSELEKCVASASEVVLVGGSHRPWVAEELIISTGKPISYVLTSSGFPMDSFPAGSKILAPAGRWMDPNLVNRQITELGAIQSHGLYFIEELTRAFGVPEAVKGIDGEKVVILAQRLLGKHSAQIVSAFQRYFVDKGVTIVVFGRPVEGTEAKDFEHANVLFLGYIPNFLGAVESLSRSSQKCAAYVSRWSTGSGGIISTLEKYMTVFGRLDSEAIPSGEDFDFRLRLDLDEIGRFLECD